MAWWHDIMMVMVTNDGTSGDGDSNTDGMMVWQRWWRHAVRLYRAIYHGSDCWWCHCEWVVCVVGPYAVHCCYTYIDNGGDAEAGFGKVMEQCGSMFSGFQLHKESQILSHLFQEISIASSWWTLYCHDTTDIAEETGKYCIGPYQLWHALQQGAVQTIIINDKLTTMKITAKNKNNGNFSLFIRCRLTQCIRGESFLCQNTKRIPKAAISRAGSYWEQETAWLDIGPLYHITARQLVLILIWLGMTSHLV